jgi:iron complex outermembrane receptor protein
MTIAPSFFRKRVLLAGASALVFSSVAGMGARADQATTSQVAAGLGQASASQSESVIVRAQRRLIKEKNSPSAVTELGTAQIATNSVAGSAGTLLRQAPSVYVYSQGLGDNAPELTVRGVRGLEIATTLDGVPTQDLESPNNFYLSNNIGAVFTTNQISSVSIYPGVAYPDKNTFGTIGGTIAFNSKRPTNDAYLDVTGSVGSFGTYREGFEANSGSIDSPLGTGDNAVKVLLNYANLQTQGFIDGLHNRENEMEFALDKPYNDGLSNFQATVIYNTANGVIQSEPVPLPYLNKNGLFSNYPNAVDSTTESNDYLFISLKNDTYVNDNLSVGLTTFYRGNDNQSNAYGAYSFIEPGSPYVVGGAGPFVNNPAGFGLAKYYGPPGYFTDPNGGGSNYGVYYGNPGSTFNPYALYPAGSKACPNSVVNAYGGRLYAPCGLNDQITGAHNDTYGVQPRVTILPPDIFGIGQTIKIGGLFAKETQPTGYSYLSAFANGAGGQLAGFGNADRLLGGTERTIFQGYIQDKIDLLDNTLHLTPGGTVEGTFSSYQNPLAFPIGAAKQINGDPFGPYKATKWDREYLPFFNVSYDFDKVLPALTGVQAYGSFGESALFAPVTDFSPSLSGPPPSASIVHLYEGGVKYNTSNISLTVDYFYQKIDRDFGFFSYQSGPQAGQTVYNDNGLRETKGVEGNITYQLTPSIQLFGNFSHLLAKYLQSSFSQDTVSQDQYGIAFKGTPESGVPDWISTFGVDYSRKSFFLDNDSFNFRFQGTYTGHQYTTYDLLPSEYSNPYKFVGLNPLSYQADPALGFAGCGKYFNQNLFNAGLSPGCQAYSRYNQITAATTTNTHGDGISPFAIFSFDATYTLPTPQLPVLKHIVFDANVQNLFDNHYFQYFYRQLSPGTCPGTGLFTKGPFATSNPNGQLPISGYQCSTSFADGIPGQPFTVLFTVTARF